MKPVSRVRPIANAAVAHIKKHHSGKVTPAQAPGKRQPAHLDLPTGKARPAFLKG